MAATMNEGNAQHAWDLMKKITFAMLATRDGEKIRSRPMAAYVRPEEGAIYFLTDVRRHKDEEIAQDHHVNLGFANASAQKYVSVTGYAAISNDRAKIKELFGTEAKAWWDSADDPNIRVLKVTPEEAEYWDSPGSLISYAKMMVAAATGSRPDLGENAKVAI
ncbi:pyridoxamine 5'-phosphate oxidase family protein [Rhodopseudomonas palustris]|uniref:pyridoxamine 5'-phosphate oxidase family protein n=1 Tax=Rhodopseudomonas palustris TaxID=1076 RepID=UPI0022F0B40F|nr:pyridoxamine 5'-phosphate oxidase family protein [Rhodopseudomonas palustris]WBU30119.1 pyridoxamine 5'-phosphate oxidase family protein [Rhodopseudomonas palustris]